MKTLLTVLGFPLWFSLLLILGAVILVLFISLWSIPLAFWTVLISLVAATPVGEVAGVLNLIYGSTGHGIALLGGGIVSACLVIPVFYLCKYITKGCAFITARSFAAIKYIFV